MVVVLDVGGGGGVVFSFVYQNNNLRHNTDINIGWMEQEEVDSSPLPSAHPFLGRAPFLRAALQTCVCDEIASSEIQVREQ